MRDDFPFRVRQVLAKRVGYLCSNPDCRAPTSGPQLKDEGGLNVGRAAHITGASPGGARYDPKLSPQERASQQNGLWLCAICGDKVDKDPKAYTVELLQQWKLNAEREASRNVGRPKVRVVSPRVLERQLKRDLKLRNDMHRDFLKPFDSSTEAGRLEHQYQRFRYSRVIIHALDDTTYPDADVQASRRAGISGWFRVETFDFYHGGLAVILDLRRGVVERQSIVSATNSRWALIGHHDTFDSRLYREIRVWVLGKIPWRNIRHYDLHGDNHYNHPHIYCDFSNNGQPYEAIGYAELNDVYNWELDPALMFEYKPPKAAQAKPQPRAVRTSKRTGGRPRGGKRKTQR